MRKNVLLRSRLSTTSSSTIEEEPRNPLLDVVEDPSVPDLTEEEAVAAAEALKVEFGDVLCDELPGELPPFRPVNHRIVLIDPEVKTRPRSDPMPNKYSKQWGLLIASSTSRADDGAPRLWTLLCAMFAIPKKDPGEACFVVNLKPRNVNTVKMHTPLPDMRSVRADVAAARRSQLDFKAAFEQIPVVPEDVAKTGFSTPSGTFISRIMQMGDCNAPDTMNRVTYMMFRPYLGRFLAVFFDDAHV